MSELGCGVEVYGGAFMIEKCCLYVRLGGDVDFVIMSIERQSWVC